MLGALFRAVSAGYCCQCAFKATFRQDWPGGENPLTLLPPKNPLRLPNETALIPTSAVNVLVLHVYMAEGPQ